MLFADPVAHALAYPFAPPRFSYLFRHDAAAPHRAETVDLELRSVAGADLPLCDVSVKDGRETFAFKDRVAVISAGSNASFQRLISKFAKDGLTADFPAILARVPHLVPVYSAHISAYGSVAGTLYREQGAASLLHIAFLSPHELWCINKSEGLGNNYALCMIDRLDADLGAGVRLERALAYVSRRGAFAPEGVPLRLSAFQVEGSHAHMTDQHQLQGRLQAYLGDTQAVEAFIRQNINDADLRLARTARMAPVALPCRFRGLYCVAGDLDAPLARLPADFVEPLGDGHA